MAIQMTQAQKDAFAESVYQEIEITATPQTGTAITITNANIVQGSFSIDRSSVSGEEVEIGNVASAELIMALNNADGTFDGFAIEGATLDVGIRPLGVGSYVNIGRFIVDEVARHGTTINLVGLDYMVSLDGEMDRTIFQSDETVLTAIPKILTAVGITTTPVLDLANTTALFDPTLMNEGASYRDLLMCILEIGGANAYFLGDTLYAKWYGAVEATLDATNRTFGNMQGYAVEITGVEVVDGETTYLTGTKDYTISITNNPLITSGNVATILSGLNARLVGFSYQPYRAETLPMPWLLPLDKVSYVKDTTPYTTVVTNTVFGLNSNLSIEGKGKSPLAKGYAKKAMTKQQENTMKALEDKIETEFAEVSNYFWHDADGAHVSDTPRATTGKNVLIDNDSVDIKNGDTVLATFGEEVALGDTDYFRTRIRPGVLIVECGEDPNSVSPSGEHYAYQGVRLAGRSVSTQITGELMLARVGYHLYSEHGINGDGSTSYTYVTETISDGADVNPMKQTVLYGETLDSSRSVVYDVNNGIRLYATNTSSRLPSRLADPVIQMTWDGSISCIGKDIPQNSNLNNYIVPGEYVCRFNTHVATLTNAPTTNAFRMTVTSINQTLGGSGSSYNTYYVVQEVTDYLCNHFLRNGQKNSDGTWSFSQWYRTANNYRSSPTITRNTSYVTSDWGNQSYIQSNILYLNIWFKISGAVPYNTTLFTISGVKTSRGYFPVHLAKQTIDQVKTENNGNTLKVNGALSASTAYHYINAVIPLL